MHATCCHDPRVTCCVFGGQRNKLRSGRVAILTPKASGAEVPVPLLGHDLAVEILCAGSTPREMERKRRDYFEAGVRLFRCVDIRMRTVAVYTSPDDPRY